MITQDFHRMTLSEAYSKIDQIVADVRMYERTESAELITGQGKIQRSLIIYLHEYYNLIALPKLGNAGVLVLTIE